MSAARLWQLAEVLEVPVSYFYEGLTRDQRFFMGFGSIWRDQIREKALRVQLASDPHSPGRIRTNGTPSNVPAFAAAFNCKPGDALANPEGSRVVIW